jgi:NADH:ubiquinone oxidoreductase subunit 3 (subunit A)
LLGGLSDFVVLLAVSIGVALIVLWIGNEIAPKGKDTPGKLAPYACGEDFPAINIRMNVDNFFIYAVYFMIFDVLGFVMVTTLGGTVYPIIPVLFGLASLISILVLNSRWKGL